MGRRDGHPILPGCQHLITSDTFPTFHYFTQTAGYLYNHTNANINQQFKVAIRIINDMEQFHTTVNVSFCCVEYTPAQIKSAYILNIILDCQLKQPKLQAKKKTMLLLVLCLCIQILSTFCVMILFIN